jgi:hypothetical protein
VAFCVDPRGAREELCLVSPISGAEGIHLFSGINGGDLPSITYRRAWDKARAEVLTEAEYASPLSKRIYDLRHACLST